MTEDEFINMPKDSRVKLNGDLADRFGFESEQIFILKEPGDCDGSMTTPERYNNFHESLAHVYVDDGIMRFNSKIGDVSNLDLVHD